MGRLIVPVAVVALGLAACSSTGGGGKAAAPATTHAPTTTEPTESSVLDDTSLSPDDQAFAIAFQANGAKTFARAALLLAQFGTYADEDDVEHAVAAAQRSAERFHQLATTVPGLDHADGDLGQLTQSLVQSCAEAMDESVPAVQDPEADEPPALEDCVDSMNDFTLASLGG